jgi:hypothetical protein
MVLERLKIPSDLWLILARGSNLLSRLLRLKGALRFTLATLTGALYLYSIP